MTTVRLTFAVGNVRDNPPMPISDATEDIARLVAIGADVTAGIEIRQKTYKQAFRQAFKAVGQRVYNLHTEEPIGTARLVVRSWFHKVTDGVKRISPSRFNAGVRLQSPIPLLVIAKHPASGANRRGEAARKTFGMRIRRRLFALDTHLTSRLIHRRNRKGITVVVLMDSNNPRETTYTSGQIIAAHAGLMWITVHPAHGVEVTLGAGQTVPVSELHTDHPFIAREIQFTTRP